MGGGRETILGRKEMTKLAILSDIHADAEALRDALSQIDEIGCELIVCAGDIVDSGRYPEETISLLRERNIPCVRGNHDRWAIGRGKRETAPGNRRGAHGPGNLSKEALAFLEELPLTLDMTIEGVRVAIRHGTPKSDMEGIDPLFAMGTDARRWLWEAHAHVLVVGHTHIAFAMEVAGGGLIVNPGTLLREPVEGANAQARRYDPEVDDYVLVEIEAGTFGILELPSKAFRVHRASDGSEVTIPRVVAKESRSL